MDTSRDHQMNDSGSVAMNNISAVEEADDDESFDMLANMPPTPAGFVPPSDGFDACDGGGGFNGNGGSDDDDADESFTDMLGIRDSPTTPAAVAQQGLRRSPRLAAQLADVGIGVGVGTSTGGRPNRSLVPPGSGVKGGGRWGVGGGGIGGASAGVGGGATPYSSRRSGRRAAGQGAFPERACTPGTAHGDGDDANASFR